MQHVGEGPGRLDGHEVPRVGELVHRGRTRQQRGEAGSLLERNPRVVPAPADPARSIQVATATPSRSTTVVGGSSVVMAPDARVGDAAAQLGLPAHVLRHWDALGVVVPDRTPSGHREYTEEHVRRLRVVRACRDVGLSLAEVLRVLHRGSTDRDAVIGARLAAIRRHRAELEAAETFLVHVRQCRHDLLSRCPDCSTCADRTQPGSPDLGSIESDR